MALSDLCISTVTVAVSTYSNVRGVPTDTTTTSSWSCSVQPMPSRERATWGVETAEVGYMLYAPNDPSVKVGDVVTWGVRKLAVLGPAQDMAGRGEVFAVACKELT
jgi:plastocyanin